MKSMKFDYYFSLPLNVIIFMMIKIERHKQNKTKAKTKTMQNSIFVFQ